jgi:hypothetical protein
MGVLCNKAETQKETNWLLDKHVPLNLKSSLILVQSHSMRIVLSFPIEQLQVLHH